ncbi:MAG: redoxin domain-containing protein [Candidatus Marinimicrobia bacterium]|nr:redoxin domain-containing protein [Candidatus Neomarinimicrobiota bacterium]
MVLPLAGLAFLISGMVNSPTAGAWAYGVVGLLTLASAFGGFYALSRKLPRTFTIGDTLAIIKSIGLTGEKADSPADREFTRWTHGLRAGVQAGTAAPDGPVVTMTGEAVRLSSFFSHDPASPLVLNFGSYTCPHHRKRLGELQALMDRWESRGVRLLTVYTAEAHPEDGWTLPHQYDNDAEYTHEADFCFYYAQNMDDRRKMAQWFIDKKHFNMPVVLDSMDDGLLRAYNTWPIRLYIITQGQVTYCGEQGPFGYDPASVDRALGKLLG